MKWIASLSFVGALFSAAGDTWPDGSEIDSWFSDKRPVSVADLGKRHVLTECGIPEGDGVVRTRGERRPA